MRAKLVQIGNSKGVRLPKAMIEEAGLGEELEISVRKGEIVIARVKGVREGWAEAFKDMVKTEDPAEWDDLEDFSEDLLPEEDWSELFAKHEKKNTKKK